MNKTITVAALAALTVLGGCAPLSQAGLVYSSRAQVGVNMAGGTPETPGFNVNIGMNVNDSAYIPVVVGRSCELSNRPDCNQYLMRVLGGANAGDSQSTEDGRRSDQNGETNAPAAPVTGQTNTTKALQPSAAAPIDPVAREAAQNAQAAAQEATALAQKVSRQSSNTQSDALSVYGTFDSNAGASPPGTNSNANANLRLGRIFSTGVASQNLTQGQRDAVRADALTRCMAQATTAAAAGTIRDQLLAACATTTRSPSTN
jgi:hypothetical protein